MKGGNKISPYIDTKLEDMILKACFTYNDFLAMAKDNLLPSHFGTKLKADLYSRAVLFYKKYNKASPNSDAFITELELTTDADLCQSLCRVMLVVLETPTPAYDYVIKKTEEVVEKLKLRKALFTASQLIDRDYKEAKELLISTLRGGGIGSSAWKNKLEMTEEEIRGLVYRDDDLICKTRIHYLDKIITGIYRKELFVIMAPLSVGKSWMTVHLAKSALLDGRYVLYFCLEMSEAEMMKRFLQSFAGAYNPRSQDDMEKEVDVWDAGHESMIEGYQAKSLLNVKRTAEHLKNIKDWGGTLQIKEYPSSVASLYTIERDMKLFEITHNKAPDIVIIDGLSDLAEVRNPKRESRVAFIDAVSQLARIANESACGIVFTHQANRQAINAKVVTAAHASESIGVMQKPAIAVSLAQTPEDYKNQIMRLYVARSRGTKKWECIQIKQLVELGQFCAASQKLNIEGEVIGDEGYV